jgi:hypothetical protein
VKDIPKPFFGTTRRVEIAKGGRGGHAEMDVVEGLLVQRGSGGLELRYTGKTQSGINEQISLRPQTE